MDWRLQIMKRALMCRVPFGNQLRRLKRKLLGYVPDPENLRYTLENLEQMKSELASLNRSFHGVVLEIGSGWFPAIPVMLALERDVDYVYMTDLTPHMDDTTVSATLDYLKKYGPKPEQLEGITSLRDLPVSYLAPFDVSGIDDQSLDFVISRTVLEHIPAEELVELLSMLRPKLAPGGLMVHLVDNSDHLEFSDKSISRINFLTWSERQHRFFNSLMKDGENRLRHHEYAPIFRDAGLTLLKEKAMLDSSTIEIADKLDLQPPYSGMTPGQVAILTSIFILSPDDHRAAR